MFIKVYFTYFPPAFFTFFFSAFLTFSDTGISDAVDADKNLIIVSLNCRSVKNKAVSLCDFILSNQIDLFAITETWLEDELDKYVLSELVPNGYDVQHVPRYKRKGGGVAIVHSNAIKLKPIDKFSANINC